MSGWGTLLMILPLRGCDIKFQMTAKTCPIAIRIRVFLDGANTYTIKEHFLLNDKFKWIISKLLTAQFEHKSGDKNYNLKIIETLCETAVRHGASAVAFHECSITGYTFARHLSKEQLLDIAEYIPAGESIARAYSNSIKI